MEIRLDTRLEIINDMRTKASIHLDFAGNGITVSNILIHKSSAGKWSYTLPLMQINNNKRPVLSFQGEMKKSIFSALDEDHLRLRAQNERTLQNSRLFHENFILQSDGALS